VHGEHEGHEQHDQRSSRLERKLERLFDRVDASGDGSVDTAELTSALEQVAERRHCDTPATRCQSPEQPTETPAPSEPTAQAAAPPESQQPPTSQEPQAPTAAGATFSYTSVTVVVAVRQYTAINAMR